MANPQPPYEEPRDAGLIYTALVVIALLFLGALIWTGFDTTPDQQSAQNQIKQSTNPAPRSE